MSEKNGKMKNLVQRFMAGKIDRRTFLIVAASFGGGYALSELIPFVFQSIDKSRILSPGREGVLKEVLRHLFPVMENAPGADDINALIYLQFVLADPNLDPRDQKFIVNGIGWLEEECQTLFTRSFTDLRTAEKEQALRKIEKDNWGERWISNLLKYTFEALLTDPIYGGNPNKIGWKWLSHIAGEPRPNMSNRYGSRA